MTGSLRVFVAILGVLTGPSAASGQAIRGYLVDDENLSPVADAQVSLFDDDRRVRTLTTDSAGFFFLPLRRPGTYTLEANQFGYGLTRSQSVEVVGRDTVTVEFRIHPEVILLDPIVVTSRGLSRGRDQFQRRLEEWGEGIFLGPEDIDSIVDRHIGDVFRNQEDIFFTWRGRTPVPIPHKGNGCFQYMVNGVPVQSPNPWAHYLMRYTRPEDLRAVEIYRSAGEAPRELRHRTFSRDGLRACGLVVFWTRGTW